MESSKTKDLDKQIVLHSSENLSPRNSNNNKSLDIFKIPAPPPKKKVKVLDEDKYVEGLEKIIQRDFFPDLEKLQAQNAYLQALENNDMHMLRELYSKYSLGKKTPRTSSLLESPATFETPEDLPSGGGGKPPGTPNDSTPTHLPMENPLDVKDDDIKSTTSERRKVTLNEYLDKYTSEDNQSFEDIMSESDRKHRIKFGWLYDAEVTHRNQQLESLILPSIEQQAALPRKPHQVDTWSYKNQNYIMYIPHGVPFTAEEEVERAKKKPEVNIENTRFEKIPYKDFKTGDAGGPENQKKNDGKIGVDGKEVENDPIGKVNGYGYVRTPSPNPGVAESPLMTWGEIEGTPFRLDGSDTPIPANPLKPFKILDQSKREKIAIELSEKVSQRYRDKKQKAINVARSHLSTPSPRPSSSLDSLSSMSPAAKRFALTHLGSKIPTDKTLRASYTPSRESTPSRTLTPNCPTLVKSKHSSNITPSSSSASSSSSMFSSSTPNLTDDLIQIPDSNSKRSKAGDFF